MTNVPTDEEFRKAGFTAEAANYPLTTSAVRVLAEFNGVTPEQLPQTYHYAPNPGMQLWLDELGNRDDRGLPIYQSPGRLITPSQYRVKP